MKDRIINIFFAHTEDGLPLYNIANHEIELINNCFSTKIPIHLKLHSWKHVSVSNMGNPEQKVLEQMPIEESNIFIAVFRFHYGNPTGNINPDTGEPYKSGMEEEFLTAYRCWKKNNVPDMIILKSEEDIPRKDITSPNDFSNLALFFNDFRANGSHPGLYSTFSNETEFSEVFRRNIIVRVLSILLCNHNETAPKLGKYYQMLGVIDLYFDEQNNERNNRKINQIKETHTLRLHARTCYNFISSLGRFHAEIYHALQCGMHFRLVMQNPWSLNALYAAGDDREFKRKFSAYQRKKISPEALLEAYKNCHWYKERYLSCVEGYKRLKKRFRGKIQLRLCDMDLSNSILLSDDELFFEPYFNSISVGPKNIPLYEIRATKNSELYKDASRDFEDIWSSSCDFNVFCKNEDKYRTRLCNYLESDEKK